MPENNEDRLLGVLRSKEVISNEPAISGWVLDPLRNCTLASRSYFNEGEYKVGATNSALFYGVDQIGSVRRAFASVGSAPAYDYDPYGVALQTTASVMDFGYAGMFSEPASQLNLTWYRAYQPQVGRWFSRDPVGEPVNSPELWFSSPDTIISAFVDQGAYPSLGASWLENGDGPQNGGLYGYVSANPLTYIDPHGLIQWLGPQSGGRICGFINNGWGFRMDYHDNPYTSNLHFHWGRLKGRDSWAGHRPWYAPWQVFY